MTEEIFDIIAKYKNAGFGRNEIPFSDAVSSLNTTSPLIEGVVVGNNAGRWTVSTYITSK